MCADSHKLFIQDDPHRHSQLKAQAAAIKGVPERGRRHLNFFFIFSASGHVIRASLAGAGFLIIVFLTSIAIARTEFGLEFVRGLA